SRTIRPENRFRAVRTEKSVSQREAAKTRGEAIAEFNARSDGPIQGCGRPMHDIWRQAVDLNRVGQPVFDVRSNDAQVQAGKPADRWQLRRIEKRVHLEVWSRKRLARVGRSARLLKQRGGHIMWPRQTRQHIRWGRRFLRSGFGLRFLSV